MPNIRTAAITLLAAILMLRPANAQEHLEPETGLLAEYDTYHFKIRELFAAAQKEEIICQVTILASFSLEQMVGVRKTATAHEVFSITPDSSIWDTEILEDYEAGRVTTFDDNKKVLPLEKDESYLELKKRTPADFRKIATKVTAVEIDEALANRISSVWERMISESRYPKETRLGLDGTSYHFSMFVIGRGVISGQIWSPDEGTKTAALVDLAEAMSSFVNGKAKLEALEKAVSRAEKLTKS